MSGIIVLDTNVLIHDPNALFNFKGDWIVVPMTVIEEIDNFKKGVDEKGRNARQISRYLDKLRDQGSLQKGVEMDNGSTIQVVMSKKVQTIANDVLLSDEKDNLIIGTALFVKEQNPDKEVTLISKDANVRIKADAIGLKATDFEADRVNFEELYTGVSELEIDSSLFDEFIENKTIGAPSNDLISNQYVRLSDKNNPEKRIISRYHIQDNSIRPMTHYDGGFVFGIQARNEEQAMALDLLLDDDIKLVTLIGKAGTGKTLLAIAAGLHKVIEENKYKRLIISRPISPLGKDLGYLPGTKSDKLNPWMQPIYDNMEILIHSHGEIETEREGRIFHKRRPVVEDYLDQGWLELEPLTYIRGRSMPNQFMIIDEAQNLTPHEMKTIITRAGEGTKVVLTGDPYQIDIPYLDSESNGLSMSVEKLKEEEIVGHITLEKGERSKLADIAAKHF